MAWAELGANVLPQAVCAERNPSRCVAMPRSIPWARRVDASLSSSIEERGGVRSRGDVVRFLGCVQLQPQPGASQEPPLTLTLSPPRDPWSANWGWGEGSGGLG